jgi:hypothetical protein
LDRYDYLLYMDKLLASAKRVHDPRPEDLVQDEELMADVGVIDTSDNHAGAGGAGDGADGDKRKAKRRPGVRAGGDSMAARGPAGSGVSGLAGMSGIPAFGSAGGSQGYGQGQDGANGEFKRKPGPKKGWKKEKMRQEAEAKKQGGVGVKIE